MAGPSPTPADDGAGAQPEAVYQLIRRTAEANSALVRGDLKTYLERIRLADDFTLMQPFGGPVNRGFDPSPEHLAALACFFQAGGFNQELVQARASNDLVVLVLIERLHGRIGGLPAQDWSLRVTLVFAREADEWQLVHRHADPLVDRISAELAAALARGSAVSTPDASLDTLATVPA